jgi:hypothetical protein
MWFHDAMMSGSGQSRPNDAFGVTSGHPRRTDMIIPVRLVRIVPTMELCHAIYATTV